MLQTIEIKQGTELYRGVVTVGTPSLHVGHGWFALDQKTAKIYGNVYKYTVTRSFNVVDMSSLKSFKEMDKCYSVFASQTGNPSSAFRHAFKQRGHEIERESDFKEDDLVAKMIIWARKNKKCGEWFQQVQGFGSLVELQTDARNSKHHAELMIVDPSKFLHLDGLVWSEKESVLSLRRAEWNRVQAKNEKKRNYRGFHNTAKKKVNFSLGSDSDSDDDGLLPTSLF